MDMKEVNSIPQNGDPLAALERDALADESGSARPEPIAADAFLAQPDTDRPEAVVEGWFNSSNRVAIVGQSKAKKSWFACTLAVCVSEGLPFLGYATRKTSALLYNFEVGAPFYRARLRLIRDGFDPVKPCLQNLHIVNCAESGFPRGTEGWTQIFEQAKALGAGMVVVDPFYMLTEDENDQAQAKETVDLMRKFSRSGIALVTVFHSAKGVIGDRQIVDRISGTSIIARDAGCTFSLSEHRDGSNLIVLEGVARDYKSPEPATIEFNDGRFGLREDVTPEVRTSKDRGTPELTEGVLDGIVATINGRCLKWTALRDEIMRTAHLGRTKAARAIDTLIANGELATYEATGERGKPRYVGTPDAIEAFRMDREGRSMAE